MRITVEPLFRLVPQGDREAEAIQAEGLATALRVAEDAGLERVWVELRGARAASFEVMHSCVAAASGCEALRIVADGLDVADESWIRLAEDAASADGLLGGRFELGLRALPGADWLGRIRDAWSGARVAPDAEAPRLPGAGAAGGAKEAAHIEIHPRPMRPDGPPLWVRADAEATAREAAAREVCVVTGRAEVAAAHVVEAGDAFGLEVALDLDPLRGEGLTLDAVDRGAIATLQHAGAAGLVLRAPRGLERLPGELASELRALVELADLLA